MTTSSIRHMSSTQIVERYLAFFRSRGHLELPGSPLAIPGNSTSFVIAGMQPLLPYLRGQRLPPATRLTALQRCLRSDDTDAVGTNARKGSFFQMLGNWSIGDYGKRETIEMALELLLDGFGLDRSHLHVSIFAGDPELCLLPDELARETWLRLGISSEHIVPLGTDENLWTMGGPGPCGPCTEIFVDRGPSYGCNLPDCRPGCSCDRYPEIWNLVFMEYERTPQGRLLPLPKRNIDTGMGLERMAAVLQGAESIFSIDLFQPAREHLQHLAQSGVAGGGQVEEKARRMILDHTRAALFAGLAGVEPGRDGRNSVVRRLIRRASRQGRLLGIDRPFLSELVLPLAQGHRGLLTELEETKLDSIAHVVGEEEERFARVLTLGLKLLAQLEPTEGDVVSGAQLFLLHAEKGFPPDLAAEVLGERGLSVDWSSYDQAVEEHRHVSRKSAENHFHHV